MVSVSFHRLWVLPFTPHLFLHIGKYVGNRPVKLRKADAPIKPVEIGHRKAKQLEKERKGKGRHHPY